MKVIRGKKFYKVDETIDILKAEYGILTNRNSIRYKIEVFDCYVMFKTVMYVPDEFVEYLALDITQMKNEQGRNYPTYKRKLQEEIFKRVEKIEKEFNLN